MLRIELLTPDGRPDGRGFVVDAALGDPDEAGSRELAVEVRWTGSEPVERGVRIGLDLGMDLEVPRWLIPGLFYGENRPVGCRRRFPRYERGTRDPEAMTCETWSFRADR